MDISETSYQTSEHKDITLDIENARLFCRKRCLEWSPFFLVRIAKTEPFKSRFKRVERFSVDRQTLRKRKCERKTLNHFETQLIEWIV